MQLFHNLVTLSPIPILFTATNLIEFNGTKPQSEKCLRYLYTLLTFKQWLISFITLFVFEFCSCLYVDMCRGLFHQIGIACFRFHELFSSENPLACLLIFFRLQLELISAFSYMMTCSCVHISPYTNQGHFIYKHFARNHLSLKEQTSWTRVNTNTYIHC